MAHITLNFDVGEAWGLEEDVAAFKGELRDAMIKALPQVREAMYDTLIRHIETDVYSYDNKEYPRRADNPRFGTPLIAVREQSTRIGDISADGMCATVGFNYMPDGSHSGTTADLDPKSDSYDADAPRPIKPNPVHRDDLIRRIETGRGYDWKGNFPKREFWQNTVNELVDGKMLEDYFLQAMAAEGIEVDRDFSVEREPQDGDY